MRLVRNPSYKHSKEDIEQLKSLEAYIYYRDYSQLFEVRQLIEIILFVKNNHKLKANTIKWMTKILIDDKKEKEKQYLEIIKNNPEAKNEIDSDYDFGVFVNFFPDEPDQLEEDYISVLKTYEKNRDKLPDLFSFTSVSHLSQAIEGLSTKGLILDDKALDIFFEIGDWFIAMPHTTDSSIFLGKYTDWCTARSVSQNLFLNYVAREDENIVLFYIINTKGNSMKNPYDKLCLGFYDCEPEFNNQETSVNANNKRMKKSDFVEIFGEDNFELMLEEMKKKCESVKGKHPAKKEMERIAKSFDLFLKKINEFKNDKDKIEFEMQIAKYKLYEEIQFFLLGEGGSVAFELYENEHLSDSIIKLIIQRGKDHYMEAQVILTNHISDEVQTFIMNYYPESNGLLRQFLAKKPEVTEKNQIKLSRDYEYIRKFLASNPKITEKVQNILLNDVFEIRREIAKNIGITDKVKEKIAKTQDLEILYNLAEREDLPELVQLELLKKDDSKLINILLRNKSLTKNAKMVIAKNSIQEYEMLFGEEYE